MKNAHASSVCLVFFATYVRTQVLLQNDVRWEGGIDRGGVIKCHMGASGGDCISSTNCVIPQGKAQMQHCMRERMERPSLGKYVGNWSAGIYRCGCCNASLFASQDKFDAGEQAFTPSPALATTFVY
jgi:hypothetical protein